MNDISQSLVGIEEARGPRDYEYEYSSVVCHAVLLLGRVIGPLDSRQGISEIGPMDPSSPVWDRHWNQMESGGNLPCTFVYIEPVHGLLHGFSFMCSRE